MGADSKIEWTDHTFNAWWGCEKIDPECKHCYAASFAKRTGHDVWGALSPRRFFGAKHWLEPIAWDRAAARLGVRERVFCSSMSDVFEDRADLEVWRLLLWALIGETPHLDWMLLSKRPENMGRFAPGGGFPPHVLLGTTAGTQATLEDNVPGLMRQRAARRFVSMEPLLERVDFDPTGYSDEGGRPVDLVIVGAESGHGARPMDEDWVREIRDNCIRAGVPFFYKQKLDEKKRKVSLPLLDGRQWAQRPAVRA